MRTIHTIISAYARNIHHALKAFIATDANGSAAKNFATSIIYVRSIYAGRAIIVETGAAIRPATDAIADAPIAHGMTMSASKFAGRENTGSRPF